MKVWLIIATAVAVSVALLIFAVSISLKPKAGVIPITGTIEFSQRSVGWVEEKIEQASSDPTIKAFVFQINSPGGSVVASRQLAQAIKATRKPSVCWLGDLATSGAYWAASSCDRIVADPLTLTGSIGVSSSYLEFSGLLRKYGIEYERLVSGRFKDIGSPYRNLTAEERVIFQKILQKIHSTLLDEVAANRRLSKVEINEIGSGKIYLGSKAKEFGLVDRLGGKAEVKEILKELTGQKLQFKFYRRRVSLLAFLEELGKIGQFGLAKLALAYSRADQIRAP